MLFNFVFQLSANVSSVIIFVALSDNTIWLSVVFKILSVLICWISAGLKLKRAPPRMSLNVLFRLNCWGDKEEARVKAVGGFDLSSRCLLASTRAASATRAASTRAASATRAASTRAASAT